MSTKRDIIAEIERRKSGLLVRVPRLAQTRRRLLELLGCDQVLNSRRLILPARFRREMRRYFPIAVVAISEGYFRLLYQELIDSGDPYRSNASSFKEIRCDIDTLLGVGSRASVGDIIAHQLAHNSPGQIEQHMSTLLGEDFPKQFHERLRQEDRKTGVGDLFEKRLMPIVHSAFTWRHKLCHELGTRLSVPASQPSMWVKVFMMWIHIVDEHVQAHQEINAT